MLNVQNGLALGLATTAGGGAVTVNSGGTLQLQGGITVGGKTLTLNGTGFGNVGALPQGALVNQAGNNTWAGNITLTGTVGPDRRHHPAAHVREHRHPDRRRHGTTLFVDRRGRAAPI